MKKFLVAVILLVTTIFVVDKIAYHTLNFLTSKSNIRFSRAIRNVRNDIVVLGDSRGVNSINEAFWNDNYSTSLINMSFNGMQPTVLNSFVNDLADAENTKDAIFFVELTTFLPWQIVSDSTSSKCLNKLSFSKQREVDDFYLPFRNLYPSVDTVYSNRNYGFNDYLKLLNFNTQSTYRILLYLLKNDKEYINSRTIDLSIINYYKQVCCVQVSIEDKAFEELLSIAKNKALDLRFFIAPFHQSFRRKLTNYDSAIKYMSDKYKIHPIDLNEVHLLEVDFADGYHTNVTGSKKLTEFMHSSLDK
ncbi:MAG: hypothetical protein RIF36_27505 [Imperialibacter sp.]|uniref:hypothetical protein n=1 Tax=Imperialibacter sp. TaxID=2038411 RepID=UPI0032EC9CDC